jgi:hypothetical protein
VANREVEQQFLEGRCNIVVTENRRNLPSLLSERNILGKTAVLHFALALF